MNPRDTTTIRVHVVYMSSASRDAGRELPATTSAGDSHRPMHQGAPLLTGAGARRWPLFAGPGEAGSHFGFADAQ